MQRVPRVKSFERSRSPPLQKRTTCSSTSPVSSPTHASSRLSQVRIPRARDRVRLKLTLRGKRLGLSLSEIRELLDMYDAARGDRGQLERFLEVLQKRRSALEQQREDIEAVLGEISSFEQQCHELLQKKRGGSSKKPTGERDSEATV